MRKTDKPIISSCQMVGECKFPADNNPPPSYSTQHTTQQVMSERIHQSKKQHTSTSHTVLHKIQWNNVVHT